MLQTEVEEISDRTNTKINVDSDKKIVSKDYVKELKVETPLGNVKDP